MIKITILLITINLILIQGEKDKCSWYGVGLDGAPTASGEQYDGKLMTAAHKSLPFGTIVSVNCADGGSVTVRINDRGPAAKELYLSEGAGKQLGIRHKGVCKCQVIVKGRSKINPPGQIEQEQ